MAEIGTNVPGPLKQCEKSVSRQLTTTPISEVSIRGVDESDVQERGSGALFILTLAYLLVDYGRPQDIIPGLGVVRPAMIVTVLIVIALFWNRERWMRGNVQLRCIWAFVLLLAVHVPLARNNYFAYKAWTGMLLYVPFILALPVSLNSLKALKRTLGICAVLMAYQAAYAIFHGGMGTGSQFFDENDLSLYLNAYLPIAYFLFTAERRIGHKLFYLGSIVVGLGGIVTSMSRGGFVGLLAIGTVTWLVSRRKILALVVLASLAASVFLLASDAYWARIATSTSAESGTAKERVESWKSAWNMFTQNPMGVGGNNFPVRFSEYQTQYFKRGMWGRAAHSLWFTLISELGIPGALIFAFLLVYNLRACFRIRKCGHIIGGDDGTLLVAIGSAYLASLAGFFACATFLSVLYYPHYWYLTGFIVATGGIAHAAEKKRLADSPLQPWAEA